MVKNVQSKSIISVKFQDMNIAQRAAKTYSFSLFLNVSELDVARCHLRGWAVGGFVSKTEGGRNQDGTYKD